MNTKNTRNLITSTILALSGVIGLIALLVGSKEVIMSFGVVAALATLGAIELQNSVRRFPKRQPKEANGLFRSFKSKA